MHFVLKVLAKQFIEAINVLEKVRIENPREEKIDDLYYLLKGMEMEVHQLLQDFDR